MLRVSKVDGWLTRPRAAERIVLELPRHLAGLASIPVVIRE
jgi:hypothetical protein